MYIYRYRISLDNSRGYKKGAIIRETANPPPPPSENNPFLTCIEMNSTFYDVLKLKKAIQFKEDFDWDCYVAGFETLF